MHYARKVYRFWNGYELPQIVSYDYYRRQFKALWFLPLPFFVLSGLGLAGLGLLPSRPRWILIVLMGGYFLSLLLFFPTSRYRQPIAPLLAIGTAVWLVTLWRQPARRRVWAPVGILLMAAFWPQWAALSRSEVLAQVHLHQASRASKLHNLPKTLDEGRLAEAVRPGMADTPYLLAFLLEDLGERQQAIEFLSVAAGRAPRNRLVPYQVGRNYEAMGQSRQAIAAYERAASLDPDWSYPWLRCGLILNGEGRKEEALHAMQQAYERAPGNRRVRSNLASLYAESGDLAHAHGLLVSLTRDYPLYVNGWYNRALVEYQSGRVREARDSLAAAGRLPGLTDQERQQIRLLARLTERPDDP